MTQRGALLDKPLMIALSTDRNFHESATLQERKGVLAIGELRQSWGTGFAIQLTLVG